MSSNVGTLERRPSDEINIDQIAEQIKDYKILRKIGEGGHGAVYKALDIGGRIVAIKLLRKNGHQYSKRFVAEMINTITLSGGKFVNVIEAGFVENRPFIVLEYMAGGNLNNVMKKRGFHIGGATISFFKRAVGQVLDGIAYLHEKGVIHRDIKPGNILADKKLERFKIADFGGMTAIDTESERYAFGTKGFMPEDKRLLNTPRQDVYASAYVAYYVLVGMYPDVKDGKAGYTKVGSLRADVPDVIAKAIDSILHYSKASPEDGVEFFRIFNDGLINVAEESGWKTKGTKATSDSGRNRLPKGNTTETDVKEKGKDDTMD